MTKQSIREVSAEDLINEYLITRGQLIRDELIKRHMNIGVKLASKYASAFGTWVCDEDDFMDWAMEGVWQGIEKFDPSKGVGDLCRRLATCIFANIRSAIHDGYRNILRRRNRRELAQAHERLLDDYYKEFGYYPHPEQVETTLYKMYVPRRGKEKVADGIRVKPTIEAIELAIRVNQSCLPLLLDVIGTKTYEDDRLDAKSIVGKIMGGKNYGLTQLDHDFLQSVYIDEMSCKDFAERLGYSAHWAYELDNELLAWLRECLEREAKGVGSC